MRRYSALSTRFRNWTLLWYDHILSLPASRFKIAQRQGNIVDGAMENWGLIIGNSVAFLLDANNADIRAKKRVASVQSHEIAHLWYNLSIYFDLFVRLTVRKGSEISRLWNGGIICISMKVRLSSYTNLRRITHFPQVSRLW